jgi:hypothetical protein
MKNKTTQEQLIELYEQQIQDLVMMSKIELGDDVIAKIKELKSQIHKHQSTKQQMIEFGYACSKQIEMNEAGELLMVKSPEELYTQVYGGKMNMTTDTNPGNNKHGL